MRDLSIVEVLFMASTLMNVVLGGFMMIVYNNDRLYSRSIGLNGLYKMYVRSVILFHLSFFVFNFAMMMYLVSGLIINWKLVDRDTMGSLFLFAQMFMTFASFSVLLSRYKVTTKGVDMDDKVVVEPKSFFESKTFWTAIVSGLLYVSEYVSINTGLLKLSDRESMMLMFVTGLVSGLCLLAMRFLTGSPIKGSPAHVKALREER